MAKEYQWVSALSPEEIRQGIQSIIREKDQEEYSLWFGKWMLSTKETGLEGSLHFQLYYQAFTLFPQYSPLLHGDIVPQGRGSVVVATAGMTRVNARAVFSLLLFMAASLYLHFVIKMKTFILLGALLLLLGFMVSYLFAERDRPYLAIMDRATQTWRSGDDRR